MSHSNILLNSGGEFERTAIGLSPPEHPTREPPPRTAGPELMTRPIRRGEWWQEEGG